MPDDIRELSNQVILDHLDLHLENLERHLGTDVLTFMGAIVYGVDDVIRDAVEARQGLGERRGTLAVILETVGGYIEVTERIADTFRSYYDRVEFFVPNYALSAGTVLVMSGDAIHMDRYSILGPIDPQIARQPDGASVPALGYLAQYERLIQKSAEGTLTIAELMLLLEKFDAAELYAYEQQRELSVTLLKRWLVAYKFKDWLATETRRIPVTPDMRLERAEEIARKLNETERWHSHARGISMATLRSELKLHIDDFGADVATRDLLRAYYWLFKDYLGRAQDDGAVHVLQHYNPLPSG